MVKLLLTTAALMTLGLSDVMAAFNQYSSLSPEQKLALQQQLFAKLPKQPSNTPQKHRPHYVPHSKIRKSPVQEPVPMPNSSSTQKTFQSGDGSSLYFRR